MAFEAPKMTRTMQAHLVFVIYHVMEK